MDRTASSTGVLTGATIIAAPATGSRIVIKSISITSQAGVTGTCTVGDGTAACKFDSSGSLNFTGIAVQAAPATAITATSTLAASVCIVYAIQRTGA